MGAKVFGILVFGLLAVGVRAEKLSAQWEELTAPDFVRAVRQAQGVCVLPFGIIEKPVALRPGGAVRG